MELTDELPEVDKQAIQTLILTATPMQSVEEVVRMAYRIGRAQGRIEGLDRAQEIREEVDRA